MGFGPGELDLLPVPFDLAAVHQVLDHPEPQIELADLYRLEAKDPQGESLRSIPITPRPGGAMHLPIGFWSEHIGSLERKEGSAVAPLGATLCPVAVLSTAVCVR